MTGFVYRWTNQINGKWYIGSHKGTTDDGYRHSSAIVAIAEERDGIENFAREILFEGDYENDNIKDVEAEYLRKYDAANNRMSYNRTNMTGPSCFSDEMRQKQSDAKKGKTWEEIFGEEVAAKKRKQQSSRVVSKETRRKMSESRKGRTSPTKGKSPWNKGKTWEEMYGADGAAEMRALRVAQGDDAIANGKRSKAMKNKPWSAKRRAAHEAKHERK